MLGLALTFALAAPPQPLADWPEFRGPGGTGIYTGPAGPTTWGTDTNVAWQTPLPGVGWSSPILVKGVLYLTTAVPDAADAPTQYSLRALAVDAASGKLLWDKEVFVERTDAVPQPHAKNSHASPTPVSDGTHVFVHFGHMGTACLTPAGDVVWKSQELTYKPVHGNGASPIMVDDTLVFNCDGGTDPLVAALDKSTGKVRWRTPRKTGARQAFSFATCALITHAGRRMIVSPASDYCMGYDPATGSELWRVKYPGAGWSLIAPPVYAHGLLFVCTGYMHQHLIAFPPDGTGDITAKIAWKTRKNVPNTPTPVVVGDELYTVSDYGFLTCLDARTGTVHYAERLAGKAYSASPIVADGKLFVTSEDGVGQVIALGKTFDPLTKSTLGEKTFATFVPAGGALFVRTESRLYKFAGK